MSDPASQGQLASVRWAAFHGSQKTVLEGWGTGRHYSNTVGDASYEVGGLSFEQGVCVLSSSEQSDGYVHRVAEDFHVDQDNWTENPPGAAEQSEDGRPMGMYFASSAHHWDQVAEEA
jgi:hypothetical protein